MAFLFPGHCVLQAAPQLYQGVAVFTTTIHFTPPLQELDVVQGTVLRAGSKSFVKLPGDRVGVIGPIWDASHGQVANDFDNAIKNILHVGMPIAAVIKSGPGKKYYYKGAPEGPYW